MTGLCDHALAPQQCLEVVDLARQVARGVGLRPRTSIEIFETQAAYDLRVGSTDPRWGRGVLYGLCTRGDRGERLIYIDPDGPSPNETLAHELAHAVTPWRQNHSPTWLTVFVGIYGHLEPDLVDDAVAAYRIAYSNELH